MAKKNKKGKIKTQVMSEDDKAKLCESCLKKGKKVIMTQRDPETIECQKCFSHKPKPIKAEDKEAKRKRLQAEMDALDQE